ncbi:MAG: membrane-bound O-acyltransferase family protein [Ponticaulis sp.]|nr:membrane-bound O-acyltransferase family protein [Ponticaulis sp.]|tara:strand:+ start:34313 stop:35722 length:1410 start_codon:yes stop_codon:yes gene_type:complete
MVFSSALFLFLFLPIFLIAYSVIPFRRNILYLLFSLAFFFIGEGWFIAVMIASIAINYGFALAMDRLKALRTKILWAGIAANLALLFYFKYTGFLLNEALGLNLEFANEIHLVLGISFFTFQGLSYLIDVWRGDAHVQKDPFRLALYIAMFPQLIAGPIVRYNTIEEQLSKRETNLIDVYHGLAFFVLGLTSKVWLADPVAVFADQVFNNPGEAAGLDVAVGTLAYSLQIFFDFAGYSGMAVGLGRLTGFTFPQNFNYPYISQSITEFWRRWHISLSTWFRDYVYIPLGGNRAGAARTYLNLFIVFTVTGMWHGAAWNFLLWGWWHGLALILERSFLKGMLDKLPGVISGLYALLWVMLGWVLFRANTLADAMTLYSSFFGPDAMSFTWFYKVNRLDFLLPLGVGLVFATPLPRKLLSAIMVMPEYERSSSTALRPGHYIGAGVIAFLFAFSIMKVLTGGYSPFIYFRF